MPDYVEEFREPREQWLAGYFNWTEEADITEAERHTARDGFDAGANWMEKQLSAKLDQQQVATLENLAKIIEKMNNTPWPREETDSYKEAIIAAVNKLKVKSNAN